MPLSIVVLLFRCSFMRTSRLSAATSPPVLRSSWSYVKRVGFRVESGPSVDQPAANILSDTRTLDVEANFTLRSIRVCISRRPIQAGNHEMIIIPEKKLTMQLTIVNLNQLDTS
jgi:hypothetical protein